MCGRFAQPKPTEKVVKAFDIDQVSMEVRPSYNIAPSQDISVVLYDHHKKIRKLGLMRWGLIPFWADDRSIGNKMINARSETIAEKRSFKRSFKKKRCLIVATGFYEWQKKGDKKIPVFVYLKDRKLFGFAGIYDTWKSPQGKSVPSCSILTTDASHKIKNIHNRMPVILEKDKEKLWLNNENYDKEKLKQILHPYDDKKLDYHKVSQYVNSPENNSPKCVKAV
ncbi:MAG: SOS response-associated peptidase [Candidatus Cloacimonetes bacterium]|nr:SOS response-associated peptidase [Candidatus Cloacimonadota bacterium]MBS3767960.1 SOS response-associated peptidase [Candidatus Cloacimonadota bacterium]